MHWLISNLFLKYIFSRS